MLLTLKKDLVRSAEMILEYDKKVKAQLVSQLRKDAITPNMITGHLEELLGSEFINAEKCVGF